MTAILKVQKYSEKSFVVRGDTKEIKEKLKELNGKFNPHLQGGAGWIYPMKYLAKITTALYEIRGRGYIVWDGIEPMTQEEELEEGIRLKLVERIKELENELAKERKARLHAEFCAKILEDALEDNVGMCEEENCEKRAVTGIAYPGHSMVFCLEHYEINWAEHPENPDNPENQEGDDTSDEEAEEAEAKEGKPNPKTNIIRCGVCFEEGLECNIGPADNPICGECERELHPERFQSEEEDTSDEEAEGDDYCECCWCGEELTKTEGFMVGDEMVCEECFKKPKAEAEPKTKTCKRCKKDKPLEKFAKKTSPTLFVNCLDCRAK